MLAGIAAVPCPGRVRGGESDGGGQGDGLDRKTVRKYLSSTAPSAYFTSLDGMVRHLKSAEAAGRLPSKLGIYLRPSVLVVDEVGHQPLERAEANLVFQVISKRYEKSSIILTSNKPQMDEAKPSPIRGSARPSWTGSPSMPLSSRPAPSHIAWPVPGQIRPTGCSKTLSGLRARSTGGRVNSHCGACRGRGTRQPFPRARQLRVCLRTGSVGMPVPGSRRESVGGGQHRGG